MSIGSRISKKISSFLTHIFDIKIFAISETCKSSHIKYGYNPKNFIILYPAVNANYGYSIESIIQAKRKSRRLRKSLKLIMVARFDKVKNFELAFRLYEYFNGNFVLDIYGNGISPKNSYLKNMLDEYIPKSSLKNLGLKGQVTNLNSKLIDYDFILLTSRQEGLPISIIEASQNGLLPISSDVGDTKRASSGYGYFFKDNSFSD